MSLVPGVPFLEGTASHPERGRDVPVLQMMAVRFNHVFDEPTRVDRRLFELDGPSLAEAFSELGIAQTDPFFAGLSAWGDTIWQLWEHNKNVPGAAPVLMTNTFVQLDVSDTDGDGRFEPWREYERGQPVR